MLLLMLVFSSTLCINSATESEYYVVLYGVLANQGFVQFINGTDSYFLCYDGWDEQDAAVVCRMLGYTGDGAVAVLNITTPFADEMWSHQFDCVGNETSLRNCPVVEVNVTECANQGASGVVCSNNPLPDDFFLLAFGTSIARVDRSHESLTLIQSNTAARIIAIDYDPIEEAVIWTDINLNQIAKCNLNGGQKTIIFQSGNNSVMDGIAIDSGSRLIFYTDTGYDEIGVINADTFIRTVLVNSSLDEPRKIVFDSNTRDIFWTDWGANATIERANYDGSDREVIVNTGLIWPNSLILDGDILYWCDANLAKIERIYRNGTGRTELYTSGLDHCFDFILVDGYFYCNDWSSRNIVKLSKDRNETSPYGPGLNKRYGIVHYRKGDKYQDFHGHSYSADKYQDFHGRSYSADKYQDFHGRSYTVDKYHDFHGRSYSTDKYQDFHGHSYSAYKYNEFHGHSYSADKYHDFHGHSYSADKYQDFHGHSYSADKYQEFHGHSYSADKYQDLHGRSYSADK